MSTSSRMLLVLPLAILASACGAASQNAPGPTQPGQGLGHVAPVFARAAATFQGARKIKFFFDGAGAMYKASLYHRDQSKVPAALLQLAQQQFPGHTVREFEFEFYADAGEVHEVELTTADGRDCEVSATVAGAFRYTECKLAPETLTPSLAHVVSEQVPGGQTVEFEDRKSPSLGDEVRVKVKSGEVFHYLRFRPSGELLSHTLRFPSEVEVARAVP